MLENIITFLTENNELAWIAIFLFAFMESFILSFMVSSLILFSICVFAYNTDLLGLEIIVLFAVLGSHLGDMSGFFFGKKLGPTILELNLSRKEKKISIKQEDFVKGMDHVLAAWNFIPNCYIPFYLEFQFKPVRFYISDVIKCSLVDCTCILVISQAHLYDRFILNIFTLIEIVALLSINKFNKNTGKILTNLKRFINCLSSCIDDSRYFLYWL